MINKLEYLNPLTGLNLTLFPNFLNRRQSSLLFDILENEIAWEKTQVKVFGKIYPVPRLTAFLGDEGIHYKYSGQIHAAAPWLPSLLDIKAQIESKAGQAFNSVLLNRYNNGLDKMGWHADNEKELGPEPVIASLNLGASRRMDFKSKKNPKEKYAIQLEDGMLLIMGKGCQEHFYHQIPVQKKITEIRINLTFRQILQ